ncbi:MAG: MBL fold metallo-hydrolase [Pseudomonadota bacterium]
MFDRVWPIVSAALLAGCAGPAAVASADPETSSKSNWRPYPGTSKDEEFLKNTPSQYRPFVEACNPWDDWDKPAPPFKIFGSTYYVGTCGISAILLVGDDKHILIDSGTEGGAEIVLANIRTLGFDPADIVYILHSHEHFDHVGGFARIKAVTDGDIVASADAAEPIATGIASPDDPQAGMHDTMTPVAVSRIIEDGGQVTTKAFTVTAIETPGHTLGALSWVWKDCDAETGCLTLGYADSLSPISRDGYRFSDNPLLLARHEAGLEKFGRTDCHILLTPHPSSSRMLKRMRNDDLVQSGSCAYYAMDRFRAMEKRLAEEAEGAQ